MSCPHTNPQRYKSGNCIECTREYNKRYRGRRSATSKAYYAANKATILVDKRRWQLKRLGWTIEAFDAALGLQRGHCAICDAIMATPQADHDHETGKRRELLCHLCNLGLGAFKDSYALLGVAAAYLRRHHV